MCSSNAKRHSNKSNESNAEESATLLHTCMLYNFLPSPDNICVHHMPSIISSRGDSSNAQRFQEKKTPSCSTLQHHPMIYTLKCLNILNSKMSIFQYLESLIFQIWNVNIRFFCSPLPCLSMSQITLPIKASNSYFKSFTAPLLHQN